MGKVKLFKKSKYVLTDTNQSSDRILLGKEVFDKKIEAIYQQYEFALSEMEIEFLKQVTNYGQKSAIYFPPRGSSKPTVDMMKMDLCNLYNSIIV